MSTSAVAWVEDFGSEDNCLTSLLRVQRNLSLARFAAATRVLTREYPEEPGVRQLADSYALAKRLPAQALAVVCADPTFVYWNHVTAGLIGRLRNHEIIPPTDIPHLAGVALENHPLSVHLLDINRFLVAAALVARVPTAIDCLSFEAKISFPGLGLVIQAPPDSEVVRVEVMESPERCLRLNNDAVLAVNDLLSSAESGETTQRWSDGAVLLPRVRGSEGSVLLNSKDPYYRLAWVVQQRFPGGLAAGEVSEEDLERWYPTLCGAFALLREVWPEMEASLSRGVHTIVPVMSPFVDRSISCSAQSFWGAVLCSLDAEVCLAETLIHEFSHNILYGLMDQHVILTEDTPQNEIYYSPWRPDARPLSGVLHAVYVFERVAEFYERYLFLHPAADVYRHRYGSIVGRLILGLRTLEASAQFNKEGMAFFARLSAGVEKHRKLGYACLGPDNRSELAEHLSSWQMRYLGFSAPSFTL